MPDEPVISSFRLPEAVDVEVVLVRLSDGRIVARTREELEALPAELRGTVVEPAAAGE